MMFRKLTIAAMALGLAAACTTTDQYGNVQQNRTGTGILAGAAAGALLGTLAGGDDRRNALIGAGIGALAGGAVGNYMDRQEEAFRNRLRGSGVSVRRVGNELILTMPSDVTFATGSAQLSPRFGPVLNDVADVLQTYRVRASGPLCQSVREILPQHVVYHASRADVIKGLLAIQKVTRL